MAELFAKTDEMHAATGAALVSPSDTDAIEPASVSLIVNVAGDIKVTFVDGSEGTFTVGAGQIYPFQVTKVWATGTTATGIYALYN